MFDYAGFFIKYYFIYWTFFSEYILGDYIYRIFYITLDQLVPCFKTITLFKPVFQQN